MADALKELEDFLNPEITRPRLISASVYIAVFESIKAAIIARARGAILIGDIEKRYQDEVLSLSKSPIHASLLWLKNQSAISDADIEAFQRTKDCRNRLAHDLFIIVAKKGLPQDFAERFSEMVKLIRKIETWWIKCFEIDFEVPDEEVVPGQLITISLLCGVALGVNDESLALFGVCRNSDKRKEN